MILLECLGCRVGFYSILDLIHRVVFWRLLLSNKPSQKHGKYYFSVKHKPNRRKKGKQKIKFKHAQNKAQDYFKEFLNDLT